MAAPQLVVKPVREELSLTDKSYNILKKAITSMDIYADDAQLKMDERKLSQQLGISRTPLREALVRLEQEGLVTIAPRMGVFIVQKTKQEIIEMITVWAALESMAARLLTENATDAEIASLREIFSDFLDGGVTARIDEYSDRNIKFHQTILELSRCRLLKDTADKLFLHMRGIRARTINELDRAPRSIIDHLSIIEDLENRDAALAEKLAAELDDQDFGLAKPIGGFFEAHHVDGLGRHPGFDSGGFMRRPFEAAVHFPCRHQDRQFQNGFVETGLGAQVGIETGGLLGNFGAVQMEGARPLQADPGFGVRIGQPVIGGLAALVHLFWVRQGQPAKGIGIDIGGQVAIGHWIIPPLIRAIDLVNDIIF